MQRISNASIPAHQEPEPERAAVWPIRGWQMMFECTHSRAVNLLMEGPARIELSSPSLKGRLFGLFADGVRTLTELRSPSLRDRPFGLTVSLDGDRLGSWRRGGDTEIEERCLRSTCSCTACLARRCTEAAARRSGDETVLSLRVLDLSRSPACRRDTPRHSMRCERHGAERAHALLLDRAAVVRVEWSCRAVGLWMMKIGGNDW